MRNEDRPGEPRDRDEPPDRDVAPEPEYSVAFSPRQVAGGFAILAALIVLLVRRRRGRTKG